MTDEVTGRVISLGECMVELARGSDGRFGLAYGGDTFNTAIYMARAGLEVAYATALGDDPYSDGILALARSEGVAPDLIQRHPGRMPGLYLIETTARGERTFHYWRERSPAREVLDGDSDATARLLAAITRARLVYLSGITLSLYSEPAHDRLAQALELTRANGGRVAFDPNYRPRGWAGDTARARQVMARFWRRADIGLPTFDDEAALWGDRTPSETLERLAGLGVDEAAVKLGPDGALVRQGSGPAVPVPVPAAVAAIDTTAAGDSFNAAYLARRLQGMAPPEAALAGHRLASIVVQHRGAIAPAAATAAALA